MHSSSCLAAHLKDLKLGIGSLVYMQMLPVFRRIAAKRVIKVLPFGQIALNFQILTLDSLSILIVREEEPTAIIIEIIVQEGVKTVHIA